MSLLTWIKQLFGKEPEKNINLTNKQLFMWDKGILVPRLNLNVESYQDDIEQQLQEVLNSYYKKMDVESQIMDTLLIDFDANYTSEVSRYINLLSKYNKQLTKIALQRETHASLIKMLKHSYN